MKAHPERVDGDIEIDWEKNYGDEENNRPQDGTHCPQDGTEDGTRYPQDGTEDDTRWTEGGTRCPQDGTEGGTRCPEDGAKAYIAGCIKSPPSPRYIKGAAGQILPMTKLPAPPQRLAQHVFHSPRLDRVNLPAAIRTAEPR